MNDDIEIIITGGTSGLGAAFGELLARQGYKILLIGRRTVQLEHTAQTLSTLNPRCRIDTLSLDLAKLSNQRQLAGQIRAKCHQLKYLINNAGYNVDGTFTETDISAYEDLINVHVQCTMQLSHAALPALLTNKGALINISSIASFVATPASPLYGSTKLFIKSFTDALAAFYAKQGLKALTVCPGFFRSDFHSKLGLNAAKFYRDTGAFKAFTAKQVAERALKDLNKGKTLSILGWNYQLIYWLCKLTPNGIHHLLAKRIKSARPEQ